MYAQGWHSKGNSKLPAARDTRGQGMKEKWISLSKPGEFHHQSLSARQRPLRQW